MEVSAPDPAPTWARVQEPGCFDAYPDCPFVGEGAKTAGAYYLELIEAVAAMPTEVSPALTDDHQWVSAKAKECVFSASLARPVLHACAGLPAVTAVQLGVECEHQAARRPHGGLYPVVVAAVQEAGDASPTEDGLDRDVLKTLVTAVRTAAQQREEQDRQIRRMIWAQCLAGSADQAPARAHRPRQAGQRQGHQWDPTRPARARGCDGGWRPPRSGEAVLSWLCSPDCAWISSGESGETLVMFYDDGLVASRSAADADALVHLVATLFAGLPWNPHCA